MRGAWVRGAFLLVIVLAAGVALGIWYERHALASAAAGSPMEPARMMEVFDRELGLDSAQHAGVARVLAQRQAQIDSAWSALRPAVRAAVDSTQMEIAILLRPDQRAKFMKLLSVSHPQPRGMVR